MHMHKNVLTYAELSMHILNSLQDMQKLNLAYAYNIERMHKSNLGYPKIIFKHLHKYEMLTIIPHHKRQISRNELRTWNH